MKVESKEYSWKWVTADELLSHGPCEFLYCKLTIDNQTGSAILYDGENALGTQILKLASAGNYNCECLPAKPIYCRFGLYVGSLTTAEILVQWRELEHEKREGN